MSRWLGASAPACNVPTGGQCPLCRIHWSGHQMPSTEDFRPCLHLPSPSPQSCLVLPKTERRGAPEAARSLTSGSSGAPPLHPWPPCGGGAGLRAPRGAVGKQPHGPHPAALGVASHRAGARRQPVAAWPVSAVCLPSAWGLLGMSRAGGSQKLTFRGLQFSFTYRPSELFSSQTRPPL